MKRALLPRLISRIFDPMLVLPLFLFVGLSASAASGYRWQILILLWLWYVVTPGLVLAVLIATKRIKSGWDVSSRTERVPLIWILTTLHGLAVIVVNWVSIQPLAYNLLVFWIMTLVFAIVTTFWKISLHTGMLSALITFVILGFGTVWLPAYLLLVLVGWARVVGKHHTIAQVAAGSLLPMIALPILMRLL